MDNIKINPDFSGWATKANLKCTDGRIITPDAFKHMDGVEVPLVWNHQHNDVNNVLGKALLEHREGQGMYVYGKFNSTDSGKAAKAILEHKDVTNLSIWANNLKQHMNAVLHGNIREVSLVLAGANPGAVIENVAIMHGDELYEYDDEARIYTEEPIVICHANTDDNDKKDDENKKREKGENEVSQQVKENTKSKVKPEEEIEDEETEKVENETSENETKEKVKKEKEIEHSNKEEDDSEKTIADILKTYNKEQETVLNFLVDQALAEGRKSEKENEDDEESEGGNDEMKHNVFDQTDVQNNTNVLSHSEMVTIMDEAKSTKGSLKDVCLAHGIDNIDVMFPDHKTLTNEPEFIKRNDDWVAKVLAGVHNTPFARIKTIFADITAEEARAKGYQKGKLKIEEVFKLLKRVTNPTTVYKKQKLDRDDILDITDFALLPWLKKELRMMLDEELARAILIGDGRDPVDAANDKIDEECIRPIWKMEDLFTVKVAVDAAALTTGAKKAKAFIDACIRSRKDYKGSGNPSMYMPEDLLTECLLLEDVNGRVIYDTEEKLRARLRVKEIVPVPVMEGDAIVRTDENENSYELAGLYVNLNDYNVGTDKGGEINFFDDFDIDYNQQKYLMETRCSGTLVKPFSAVAIEFKTAEIEG